MARGIGRFTVRLAVASMLAACARQEYHADTPASYLTADGCVQSNQDLLEATGLYAGRFLTVGTGDPAVSPWWEGGTTREHPEWTMNDPYLGRGYEGALTFEVAQRMGFSAHQVRFVSVGSDGLVAPGPKDFDFAVREISYQPERSQDVDFSKGYYEADQALVSTRGSAIAEASSIEELDDATLGAASGTTGLAYVEDTIRPSREPVVFDDLDAAIRGLDVRVDGIVVDLPSASAILEGARSNEMIVRRLPTVGRPEHFAMTFEEGSPFVECVNLALDEIESDGTLDELRREWLPTDVAAPLLGRS
jgi:polar amino acid transport system substrate-binding protein